MLKVIAIITWLIAGIITLATNREVPRILYFLCWITLILNLILNALPLGGN